jgi:hypothetical protein
MNRRSLFLLMILVGLIMIGQPASAKDVKSSKEFHVHLGPADDALVSPPSPDEPLSSVPLLKKRPSEHRVVATEKRVVQEAPPRHRHQQVLSTEQLLLIAFDAKGREVARTVILDPQLIRAESSDESGNLSSQKLYRNDVDFTVTLPDDPDIKEIKFYHPNWTGKEFTLELIGETQL